MLCFAPLTSFAQSELDESQQKQLVQLVEDGKNAYDPAVDVIQLTAIPMLLFGVLLDISSFEAWVFPVALVVGGAFDAFEHANLRGDLRNPVVRAWKSRLAVLSN